MQGLLDQLGISWVDATLIALSATGIYAAIVLLSRLFGQRQFSQQSTYDLAFVFALGTLLGRAVLVRTTMVAALLGVVVMMLLHAGFGWLHHHSPAVHRLLQNPPVLLVAGGELLADNCERAHVSAVEVYQQVRLHGLGSLDEVEAVVLERNGRFSVLRRGVPVDPQVVDEVRGAERLHPDVAGG